MHKTRPLNGIDFLLADEARLAALFNKRVALLTNQSSLTQDYTVSAKALQRKLGANLKAILTPEHGWSGLIGEGMSIGNGFDPHLGLPVLSLYGRVGWEDSLQDIDVLIIDLTDVGLRCYTYGLTCAKVIDYFAHSSLEIIVCDRPNPLGPDQKGPVLEPSLRSCVGHFEIPFQHGQTLGQVLKSYAPSSSCNLSVIPCDLFHNSYQYPWIPPSPNLPSWDAVLLYPALVLLEGTNVSEGRGTSLPFTSFGAPSLDQHKLVDFLNEKKGIKARPITFTPQSGKLEGVDCPGAHLIITDPLLLDAYTLGIGLLHYLHKHHTHFEWTPVKSADNDTYFIDYLLGTKEIRKEISS